MFNNIESKFKKSSLYHKNIIFLFIVFIFYFVFGFLILKETNLWIFIAFIIFLCFIIYGYLVFKNVCMKVYSKTNWKKVFNLSYTIKNFFDKQKNKDKELLKKILKEEGINTRPKVGNIIEHYRIYNPRSINSGGTFLSILAIFISIVVFIYDQNANIANEKAQIIAELVVLVLIGWAIFSSISKTIGTLYSKKSFYLRMEDLLTEIYINSEIK